MNSVGNPKWACCGGLLGKARQMLRLATRKGASYPRLDVFELMPLFQTVIKQQEALTSRVQ